MSTKDFQEATAQRILHLFKDEGRGRLLLADEVGLGKTFVARRVIELVKEWHKAEHDDFFKMVYICSNANIADQNIGKLGVGNKMNISESRLSMQHLYVTLANNEIAKQCNEDEMPETIIPLTPMTSFRMTNSQGTANERALMFCLLRRLPALVEIKDEMSRFLCMGVKAWDYMVNVYEDKIVGAGQAYISDMIDKLEQGLTEKDILALRQVSTTDDKLQFKDKAAVINRLRRVFALISIDMLDPDLVIMDEFQRFSDLLRDEENGESEQAMLVHKFFDKNRGNTKVLLLSATPYKPYSTLEEINEDGTDEHYNDFVQVMDFLFVNPPQAQDFQEKWQNYSSALKRTEVKEITPLLEAKDAAEQTLYSVMCRTERFNSGIIKDYKEQNVEVKAEDILSFAEGQKILDTMADGKKAGNMPMEYVKSSPYLLSFMDRYELKKKMAAGMQQVDFNTLHTDALLLNKYKINNYKPIPPNNGKLELLHNIVFGQRHEKRTHLLLWVPASHPYYKAGGLFESEETKHFSKLILFSSWEMVPRMVSCMMSYYAELYTFGEIKKQEPDLRYVPEYNSKGEPKKRHGLKRLREGNPLEYPCITLASLYDPEQWKIGAKLSDIRKEIKQNVQKLLDRHTELLPLRKRGSSANIVALMKVLDGQADETTAEAFIQDDAVEILADIAIGSPAVCAYRQSHDADDARRVGESIVSIFNKPESATIIDLLYRRHAEDAYYENVLDYCVIGNLQSVLDEYAHMLVTAKIADDLDEAIIGTSTLRVDTNASLGTEERKMAMRNHFAIPFIDKTVTDKSVARTANIRKAFNSPFRPFILSTTSIGQEGLDFHWYARKIVHWNLPSNPVDMEQREGRINRFKCLSLRRNIATLYGEQFKWDDMFKAAADDLKGKYSDMVPYWCLPVNDLSEEQREKLEFIERIVPLYPLSRDTYKYARLIDVLSLYRMTLGQPRQEELLCLLKDMNLSEEDLKRLTIDLCPYNRNENQ